MKSSRSKKGSKDRKRVALEQEDSVARRTEVINSPLMVGAQPQIQDPAEKRNNQAAGPAQVDSTSIAELQLKEAEWISNEHDEFIRVLQRYRSLYVTAIFLAFGWALGQVLSSPPTTLEGLRSRADVAAVLSISPLINVLFAMLMLEAHAHAADLARYRFILGSKIGAGIPPWRWNLWREKRRSSILRAPTMILNVFSAILVLLLTLGAFWFSYPALENNRWLWVLWGPSLGVFVAFLISVGIVGIYSLRGRAVVTRDPEYTEEWNSLWDDKSSKKTGSFH